MQILRHERAQFDLDEFLSRRLFAHVATTSPSGPRDSPMWYLWEEGQLWVIAQESFNTVQRRIEADPRCAVGIVDFRPETGLLQHVGLRGTGRLEPPDIARERRLIVRYIGHDTGRWRSGSFDLDAPETPNDRFLRIVPETIVMRDFSYGPLG